MKNRYIKIILAATMVLAAISASVIATFAAGADYVYAQNFDRMTAIAQGQGGMSKNQAPPSLARIEDDPASDGGKGDCVKMIMSVSNPNDPASAEEEARTGKINGSSAGTNVDRNLTVSNRALSYKTYQKLVLEVDYFLEENSSGTFESQMIRFTHGDSEESGSWLKLWQIDTSSGTVRVLGSSALSVAIPVGEWVTLSLLVDMRTGDVEFYVNNVYRAAGSIGKNKLSFGEGQWNVAKINKLSSGGVGKPTGYKGAFFVDNVRVHTYTETTDHDTVVNASGGIVLALDVTSATGNTSAYGSGIDGSGKILQTPAGKCGSVEFDAVTLDLKTLNGSLTEGLIAPADTPSIRMVNAGGIRFGTNINTAKLAQLQELQKEGLVKGVSIGTLISPLDYVKEAGEFSLDALAKLGYKETCIDVKATVGAYYDGSEKILKSGYDEWFTGAITNIRLKNGDVDFAAIGYVKITLVDGTEFYYYSYDNKNMSLAEKYAASIAEVANNALAAGNLSENQEKALKDLASDATEMTISSSAVRDVQVKRSQLFFTLTQKTDKTDDDVYCRLTYDGANGWRLQANAVDYNHFEDVGAAQALSIYMSEGFRDVMIPLEIRDENGKLVITAQNSDTYAVLSYKTFGIDFFNSQNKQIYNLCSVTADGSKITVAGVLNANEGVYGGGERFDALNRRGTTMSLFTHDSYDAGGEAHNGTYLAIPLFSTSRGGGMFINRYETMTAAFSPTGTEGSWSVAINNDLMDIYFYATGKMGDVLAAYADLTGHASLPEEWGQGTLVCRYSPDYSSLNGVSGKADGNICYMKLTDVPNYSGYYLDSGASTKVTASTVLKNGQYLYSDSGKRTYRYVVEGNEDVNGNGIFGESYFIRTTKKGSPSGAGVLYIVESLIEAGMKPTAVILEGFSWNQVSTDTQKYAELKEIADYLDKQDIKLMLYMGIAAINSSMKGYKPEYQVWASVYAYDKTNNVNGDLLDRTYKIPKIGNTDNPDTVASGGYQQYLDITDPEAVRWYMDTVWGQLIDLGVDGCKIDFCENMPNEGYYEAMTVNGKVMDGYIEYDWHDEKIFEGDALHHAYPSYFISLFYKTMLQQKAQKSIDDGFVVLSRGGGIGSQRNPYLWAGDQTRRFLNLKTQLNAVISSSISGVPFMTYDMAGYAYKATNGFYGNANMQEADGTLFIADLEAAQRYESEIFVRAIQYTIFGNSVQTHGDVRHMYQLTPEAQKISELYAKLHERLMWYSQKLSKHACDTGMPMIRHMILQYQNDANVIELDDQFMYGDALLVAPILTYNATEKDGRRVLDYASDMTRTVYLPAGTWIDLNTGKVIASEGQTIEVTVGLAQIPVFLNAESADAKELQRVFDSSTWDSIVNFDFVTDSHTQINKKEVVSYE